MTTAWSYAAVSSAPQEATLEDQERFCRETAEANGWQLTRMWRGVGSGKLGTRKLLEELLTALRALPRAERPSYLLMIRIDRMGRGTGLETIAAMAELRRLGVGIWTREQGEITLERATDTILPMMRSVVAAIENDTRREKSLAFHAKKRRAGEYGSKPPYGFVLVDKKLAPHEPEASIVTLLFEKRVTGWGYQRLAQLAKEDAPAKMRPNGELQAFAWGENTVKTILENPVYRGSIVPESLWEAVQGKRSEIRVRPATRWPWPLRGAVRCTCGAALMGEASGRKNARTRYYVCRLFQRHGNHPHHRADRLEAGFVDLLRSLEVDKRNPPRVSEKRGKILTRRLTEIRRRLGEIESRKQRAWALAESQGIPAAALSERLAALDSQAESLQAELTQAELQAAGSEARVAATLDIARVIRGLADLWPSMRLEHQRDLAIATSILVGGLWADPKRPGELLVPDDACGRGVERIRAKPEHPAALEAARRVIEAVMAGA